MEVSETAGVASDMADLYATKEVTAPPLPYGRGSEPHSEPRAQARSLGDAQAFMTLCIVGWCYLIPLA